MLSDEVLEKLFSSEHINDMTIKQQSSVASAIEDVMEQVKEDNPNATISELLSQ